MKIGLVVYAGVGAYSDDALSYVTQNVFRSYDPGVEIDDKLIQRHPSVELLNSYDLIVIGGGSLLGKCEFHPVSSIHKWHEKVKVPLAVFGTGYRYEPDKEPLNAKHRRRMQLLFDKADIITLRGYRSLYWCQRNNIDTEKVEAFGDPIFAFEPERKHGDENIIGGNVRELQDIEVQHSSNIHIWNYMAQVYDWLLEEDPDRRLSLLSFRHNNVADNDAAAAEKVKQIMRYQDRVTVEKYASMIKTVRRLSQTGFWFGQRLHPSILALIFGIPTIFFEYQFEKTVDALSVLDLTDCIIQSTDGDIRTFTTKYDKITQSRVGKKIERVRGDIYRVGKKILRLV